MEILFLLKDCREVSLSTEKSLIEICNQLVHGEFIIVSDGIVRASEVVSIKKLEEKSLDLKTVSIKNLVDELASRSMTHSERYHMQRLLQPNEICGNGPKFSSHFEGEK